MGQPVTVIEKPSLRGGTVRYELNRALTGMGHERYLPDDVIVGDRPVDVLARRIFEHGGVDRLHINGSVVTVDLAKGGSSAVPAGEWRPRRERLLARAPAGERRPTAPMGGARERVAPAALAAAGHAPWLLGWSQIPRLPRAPMLCLPVPG